ncbi:MAG TPA: hypothetical protein VH170_01185 [Chthoniobacterales bacterium]|nr:hypothetical protein [Chthoniobacterales bacterium]
MKFLFPTAFLAICSLTTAMAQDDLSWKTAIKNYRQQIKTYHFADAYAGMNNLTVERDSWKQSRSLMMTTAQRLMKWKKLLITDLNDRHYFAPVRDKFGIRYQGIQSATEQSLSVKVPYGTEQLPWTKFRSETLISVANSFIRKGSPDAFARASLSQLAAAELAHPAAGLLTTVHTETAETTIEPLRK